MSVVNRYAAYFVASLMGLISTASFVATLNPLSIFAILIGSWLAVAIHEGGHAGAAHALGMRISVIAIGLLEVRPRPLRFGLHKGQLGHDVGGYVLFDDTLHRDLTRRSDLMITLAGPLANLAVALICIAASMAIADGPWAYLIAGFAWANLAAFTISAWPFRMKSGRPNDAAHALTLLPELTPTQRRRPKRSPWQAP